MDFSKKGIVKILTKGKRGTGFIVTPSGIVFTAKHVIKNYPQGKNKNNYLVIFNEETGVFNEEKKYPYKILVPNLKDDSFLYDFAILQIEPETSTQFESVEIRLESPIVLNEKRYQVQMMGLSKKRNWGEVKPKEGPLLDYYKHKDGLCLRIDKPTTHGMSGGPVYSLYKGRVIGLTILRDPDVIMRIKGTTIIDVETYALTMSQIRDIIKEQDKIPIKNKKELLALFAEIQHIFPAFNEYDINLKLFGDRVERFRAEGPQIVDFERGDWVYVPKLSHDISKMILDGKVVILGGQPATGKSVISRYIGYEFMKEKQVAVYYIDFPDLGTEDIKDLINNLKKIINSPSFKTLKNDDKSPLFIFENIHDPQLTKNRLREKRLIPSLRALKKKVKILITTRNNLSGYDWINEKNRIDLEKNLYNKDIIGGIVRKFNKNREYPIRFEKLNSDVFDFLDSMDNLWILGWYLRVIEDSQDQEPIISDSKEFNKELAKLVTSYYEKNFPEFDIEHIKTILLILSLLSKYEIPMEKKFIMTNAIHEFQGLKPENTNQIIEMLERKREISSKKIVNLEDMSEVSFEYRIPHVKLAEILQNIYLNDHNKKKFDKVFNNYIQEGRNSENIAQNLWTQENFQLALRAFKLNKVEEDLIKIYLNHYFYDVKDPPKELLEHLENPWDLSLREKYHKLYPDYQSPKPKRRTLRRMEKERWEADRYPKKAFKIKVSKGHVYSLDFTSNLEEIPKNLKNLSELRFLDLSGKNIKEIKGLDNLQKLEELDLSGNRISKIKGLNKLQKLEKLNLRWNRISKIQGLENLQKLEKLDLRSNRISQIQGLENLHNLIKLSLTRNYISQIQGLENLQKLEKLVLEENQILQIQGLENLHNLIELDLRSNRISQIQGLENLHNLKKLYLDNRQGGSRLHANINRISKIQGLENLQKLEKLDLRNNRISQIQGLENLHNLIELYLSSNRISQIQGLEKLQKLEGLYLSSNRISQIQGLENLQKLETLSLRENKILQIQGFQELGNLHNLIRLDLSRNRISQISQIQELESLQKLKILDLGGNLISEIQGLENLNMLIRKCIDLEDNPISFTEDDFFDHLRERQRTFSYRLYELFYPHGRYRESDYEEYGDYTPRIMKFLDWWKNGLTSSDKITLNETKGDFSRILKEFIHKRFGEEDFILVNYIRFFTELFDIEGVREQMRVYISNPYTTKWHKPKPYNPIQALERLKNMDYPLTLTPPQLSVLSEIIEMFRALSSDSC